MVFTGPVLVALGVLPALTCALAGYALRPVRAVFAPWRLGVLRAAVLVGGCAEVLVEVLSACHALDRSAMVLAWSLGLLVAAGAAYRRLRRDGHRPAPLRRVRQLRATAGRAEKVMAVALLGLLLAELLIALVSPPNNYDSQTYHLPRIEHWVVQHDVDFYPTAIHRQLTLAPGAEYLLLHLRLLTGGDALYNLLQWSAGVGCALLASRIAGQLGGSRRAQLLAAFLVGTTPLVALESSSTQTDLVVAAWVAAVATLVLDELRRRTPLGNVALLGAAAGLTALTKATGLLAVGPLLLVWGIAQLRLVRRGRHLAAAAGSAVAIVALALAVVGPYLHRVDAEYGNPLGPDYLRASISMQRHDPAAVLVNALRVGQSALDTPLVPVEHAATSGIERFSRGLGVDPDGRDVTFWGSHWPDLSWGPDEDRASFPVEAVLVLLGAGFLTVRPRRRVPADRAGPVRAYAAAFWVALLLYVATVKWQPWGNRLILFLLVLGAPLAGIWLDALLKSVSKSRVPAAIPTLTRRRATVPAVPRRRRVAAATVAVALVACGCLGWGAVGYGWPRRLVGPGSVFTVSDMQARFTRRPHWRAEYEWAAAAVRASGAHTVGLVQGNDSWEYPWWLLLRGDDLVALQTVAPDLPPARTDQVDAVVCATSRARCASHLPAGWRVHMRGGIGYALPPRDGVRPGARQRRTRPTSRHRVVRR